MTLINKISDVVNKLRGDIYKAPCLHMAVYDWLEHEQDEDIMLRLQDVTIHGCQSGVVSDLIYCTDTLAFYEKHKSQINGILSSQLLDMRTTDLVDIFGKKWEQDDPLALDTLNQNLLAWWGFETAAHEILLALNDGEQDE